MFVWFWSETNYLHPDCAPVALSPCQTHAQHWLWSELRTPGTPRHQGRSRPVPPCMQHPGPHSGLFWEQGWCCRLLPDNSSPGWGETQRLEDSQGPSHVKGNRSLAVCWQTPPAQGAVPEGCCHIHTASCSLMVGRRCVSDWVHSVSEGVPICLPKLLAMAKHSNAPATHRPLNTTERFHCSLFSALIFFFHLCLFSCLCLDREAVSASAFCF